MYPAEKVRTHSSREGGWECKSEKGNSEEGLNADTCPKSKKVDLGKRTVYQKGVKPAKKYKKQAPKYKLYAYTRANCENYDTNCIIFGNNY